MHRLLGLWWLAPLAAAAGVALLDSDVRTGDLPYFIDAARAMLSGNWSETFTDPSLQTGPLQLLLIGLGDHAASVLGVDPMTLLSVAIQVGLTALALVAASRLLQGRRDPRLVLLLFGLAIVGLGLPHGAFVDGHPAQMLIPLLWVLAGIDARDGRLAGAGALIGLSAGLETWGVLGLPVLLLATPLARAVAGFATAALVTAVLYAPFVLAGDFRMLDYRWPISHGSPIGHVIDPGTDFTWELRLVQGAAALAAAVIVVVALRRADHVIWLAPLVAIGVRLLLDPAVYSWYWIGLELLLLVGVAELATSGFARRYVFARRTPAPLRG